MDDFRQFYLSTRDRTLNAVLAATGDQPGSEDAVAEAYTRAFARWSALRGHPNPTGWVVLTALNALRSWRRRLRREVVGPVPDRPGTPAPDGDLSSLRGLIARLPRRQREVVALRMVADLSAEQTAEVLGIMPATVHVHMHRAIATLRTQLAVPAGDSEGQQK